MPFEPYASFRYVVLWPFSKQDWELLCLNGHELTLYRWHQQQIQREGPKMSGLDAAAIHQHTVRSYGREPYHKNNFPSENLPELQSLLAELRHRLGLADSSE